MQVILDAFKGINPFDKLFDGSPEEETLRTIHVLAERSPLSEHDMPRALQILEELDQISNLRIKNYDDFNALNDLIGSNEALFQALPRYRDLAAYLDRFTCRGVVVHSPAAEPSLQNRPELEIERLINENRTLQERLLQMHRELEQQQLSRAIELSHSQALSMERFGSSVQSDYALNKEFNQWIDALLEMPAMLREILAKLNAENQVALLRVLMKAEKCQGGISAFLHNACDLTNEGFAKNMIALQQKLSEMEERHGALLREREEFYKTIESLKTQIRQNEERIRELSQSPASNAQTQAGYEELRRASEQCRIASASMAALSIAQENTRQTPSILQETDDLKRNYEELWHKNRKVEEEKKLLENNRRDVLERLFNIRKSLRESMLTLMGEVNVLSLEQETSLATSLEPAETLAQEIGLLEELIRTHLIQLFGACSRKMLEVNNSLARQLEAKRDMENKHFQEMDDQEKNLLRQFEEIKKQLHGELVGCQVQIRLLEAKDKDLESCLGNEKKLVKTLQKKIEELEARLSLEEFGMVGSDRELGDLREKNKQLQKQVKDLSQLHQQLVEAKGEIEYLTKKLERTTQTEEVARKKIAQLEKELANSQVQLEIEADNVLLLEQSRQRLQRQTAELAREALAVPSLNTSLAKTEIQEEELRLLRVFVDADPERKRQFESFVIKALKPHS